MSDVTLCNLHKEEDEGYLAAEAGQGLSANIYPCGTIRFEHWRRGWRIKNDELRRTIRRGAGDGQEDEGYLAARPDGAWRIILTHQERSGMIIGGAVGASDITKSSVPRGWAGPRGVNNRNLL